MEIAGLWDRCIFNFVRNYQAVLQDCSTHQSCMRILVLYLCQHLGVSFSFYPL